MSGYDTTWAYYDGDGGPADTYDGVLPFSGYRLRADVYDSSGTKLNFGAIVALRGGYSDLLDGIGAFTLEFAADDEKVTYLAVGYELYIHRENEGLVYRGIINRIQRVVAENGQLVAKVSGSSNAIQLVWKNTLLGLQFDNVTLASFLTTMLTGTGWTTDSVGVPSVNVTSRRYDGNTKAAALMDVSTLFQYHTRFNFLAKTVDVNVLGTSSGIVFMGMEHIGSSLYQNGKAYPIKSVEVVSQADDLWNSIIPLGGGEGINQLTLRYAGSTVGARDQSSPYSISSATGPDGQTYYYLEDAASVAAYGRRQKVIVAKDVVPIAQSDTGLKNAANALYEIGSTWLQRHKDPPTTYAVTVTGLTHLDDSGTQKFKVGDKIRLIYHGRTTESDGSRTAWLTVDASLWVMAYHRSFDDQGIDTWQLTVSTVDRQEDTLGTKVAALTADMLAVKTAMHPYTHEVTHTLGQRSIAASQPQSIKVIWDANVQYLHLSKLYFYLRALRSNVSAAASESSHNHIVGELTNTGSSLGTASISGTANAVTALNAPATSSTVGGLSVTTSSAVYSGNAHTHNLNGHVHQTQAPAHTHQENTAGAYTQNATSGAINGGNALTDSQAEKAGGNDATGVPGSVTASGDNSVADNRSAVTAVSASSTVSAVTGYTPTTAGFATNTHTHTCNLSNMTLTYNIGGGTTSGPFGFPFLIGTVGWWQTKQTSGAFSGAHTHGITYGIYVDPSPTSVAAVQIWINGSNRTVALGGPWSTLDSLNSIDITQYLQSQTGNTGTPNQATNTVEFRYGAVDGLAVDIEATMRTLITSMSVIPV